jgi:hypothetical protein
MADIAKELQRLAELVKSNKDVVQLQPVQDLPFEIGGEYFIRTVTYHLTGRVKNIVGKFLVLEDAAWIADSGRFSEFFTKPSSALEVEPFGKRDVFVNTDSITDATERAVLTEVK